MLAILDIHKKQLDKITDAELQEAVNSWLEEVESDVRISMFHGDIEPVLGEMPHRIIVQPVCDGLKIKLIEDVRKFKAVKSDELFQSF